MNPIILLIKEFIIVGGYFTIILLSHLWTIKDIWCVLVEDDGLSVEITTFYSHQQAHNDGEKLRKLHGYPDVLLSHTKPAPHLLTSDCQKLVYSVWEAEHTVQCSGCSELCTLCSSVRAHYKEIGTPYKSASATCPSKPLWVRSF